MSALIATGLILATAAALQLAVWLLSRRAQIDVVLGDEPTDDEWMDAIR